MQQAKEEIKQLLDNFDEAMKTSSPKSSTPSSWTSNAEMKVMKQNMAADGIPDGSPPEDTSSSGSKAKHSDDLVGTIIDLADQFLNTKRK